MMQVILETQTHSDFNKYFTVNMGSAIDSYNQQLEEFYNPTLIAEKELFENSRH